MGLLDKFRRSKTVEVIETGSDYTENWEVKSIGNIVIPEKLTDLNVFSLANSVAEINFPIDFYADRASKLRYYIADRNGNEVSNTELTRFVSNINPIYSFSDLVYQYVFSLLADGNVFNYIGLPSSYKNIISSSIYRWDVLRPDMVLIDEYNNLSTLDLIKRSDMIKKATYQELNKDRQLEVNRLFIDNFSQVKKQQSQILSRSTIFAANKSIDTLLAVYSARYNVFANNGAAGYLARKTATASNDMEAVLANTTKRDDIIKDINSRNGLTGRKNIWGISSTPLEFVKTLATISELMPFEESLDCAIKIGAVYQIPSGLIPRKDQSTYNNQDADEKKVWENGILSVVETFCQNYTKLVGLDKIGYNVKADTSTVSALNINKTEHESLVLATLTNLEKIKTLSPLTDIEPEIKKIFDDYGSK